MAKAFRSFLRLGEKMKSVFLLLFVVLSCFGGVFDSIALNEWVQINPEYVNNKGNGGSHNPQSWSKLVYFNGKCWVWDKWQDTIRTNDKSIYGNALISIDLSTNQAMLENVVDWKMEVIGYSYCEHPFDSIINSPAPRHIYGALSASDNALYMYYGANGKLNLCNDSYDTLMLNMWRYDGSWVQIKPDTLPRYSSSATTAACYRPDGTMLHVDTWGYTWIYNIQYNTWTRQFPNNSPIGNLSGHSLIYDTNNGCAWLFGSVYALTAKRLYMYNAGDWTEKTVCPVGGETGDALVLHSSGKLVALVDSVLCAYTVNSDTWEIVDTLHPVRKPKYIFQQFCYDPANDLFVALGGDYHGPEWWVYRYDTEYIPPPPDTTWLEEKPDTADSYNWGAFEQIHIDSGWCEDQGPECWGNHWFWWTEGQK